MIRSVFCVCFVIYSVINNVNNLSMDAVSGASKRVAQAAWSGQFDELMNEGFVALKDIMKTGDTQMGIPVLDPLIINESFDVDNKAVQLKGNFYGELVNLSNYNIDKIHADMDLNVVVSVTLNHVTMSGNYSVDGTIYDIVPIMGGGQHYVYFTKLTLGIKPELVAEDGYLRMKDFGLTLNETNFQIFVEGLLEGPDVSKILAYVLNDLVSSVLKRNTQLCNLVNSAVVSAFNDGGKGRDLYNLVETVKSFFPNNY